MAPDLTDVEAARLLRKHPRTIQRWCQHNRLAGAYKAGRSWRIPQAALRDAQLEAALTADEVERPLRAATLACQQLRQELAELRAAKHPRRNWRKLARELKALEQALDGLAQHAAKVPAHWSSPGLVDT